jgi:hypothetical protein
MEQQKAMECGSREATGGVARRFKIAQCIYCIYIHISIILPVVGVKMVADIDRGT